MVTKFKKGDVVYNAVYLEQVDGGEPTYYVIDSFFYPHYVYHSINKAIRGISHFHYLETSHTLVSKLKKILLPYTYTLHVWTRKKYNEAVDDVMRRKCVSVKRGIYREA